MPRQPPPSSPVTYRQQTLFEAFAGIPSPPHRSPEKRKRSYKLKKATHVTVSDSGDEVVLGAPLPKRKTTVASKRQTLMSSPTKTPSSSRRKVEESDTDSSEMANIKFETKSSPVRVTDADSDSSESSFNIAKRKRRRDKGKSVVVSDEDTLENSGESSDDSAVAVKRKGARSISKQVLDVSSESDGVSRIKPHRIFRGVRPQDSHESDLLDGIEEDQIIESRLRSKLNAKSTFQKNLERMKQKRRGVRVSSEDEEENDGPLDIIPGAHPDRDPEVSSEAEIEDRDLAEDGVDDFIEDDSIDAAAVRLPAVFSMHTHQNISHHFKIVCQYLVHLLLTSPRRRQKMSKELLKDDYFGVSLKAVHRKLTDVRDSLASSVWRPSFIKSLQTYPEFVTAALEFAIPKCDACRLGGRKSTLVARLSGSPYNKDTLEVLNLDESDSSQDEEPEMKKEFHLGRFCATRTELYHELCHWKFALHETLTHEIDKLGNRKKASHKSSAFFGAQPMGCKPPDDPSDPNQVMMWLDERGIITAEWLNVKKKISRASHIESEIKVGIKDEF